MKNWPITVLIGRLFRDRRGATAIEYGLILALVFLAILSAVTAVSDLTVGMWGNIDRQVAKAK